MQTFWNWFWGVFCTLFVISIPVGWVAHIVRCFTQDDWGFLIAGAICFPIGWIHGLGVIFGWW